MTTVQDDIKRRNRHKFAKHMYNEYCQGVDLCSELCNMLNNMAFHEKAFSTGFIHNLRVEHRYLQHKLIWLLLDILSAYGHTEHYDNRNRSAVEHCKKLNEMLVETSGIYGANVVRDFMKKLEEQDVTKL